MYKFVAIDIDGTLLNSKSELTARNMNALKEASSKGVYIVLTSGRMTTVIQNFCREIGADKFLISENGASIFDLQKNETIYKRYIPKDTVLEILDLCIANNIYYMIYTDKELIVKDLWNIGLQ